MKLRGSIRRGDAIQIADRLRTYLRSHDQQTPLKAPRKKRKAGAASSEKKRSEKLTFAAEQWIASSESNDTKMKIAAIASLLDSIIDQVKHSNAPPEDQILTDIERQQLIAVLETALHVLRTPLVEKGLLKKTESVLKKGAESAAEKGVQQGLGKLMEGAGARILEVLGQLFG